LHYTCAAAGPAIFDLATWLGTGTGADIAVFVGGYADLRILAVGCFF
jgi:hypothetical protein